MTEPERKRLLDFLADPEADEERAILEAPPVPLAPALESRLVEAALREAASTVAPAPVVDELAARRNRLRRFTTLIGGLAAVAAVAVLILRNPSSGELPEFAAEGHGRAPVLSGGGPSPEEIHLAAGVTFELHLRPASPAPADTEVQSYLRQGDTFILWNIRPERTRVNGFHLLVPFEQIPDLRPGRSQAVFILGHKEHMPSQTEIDRLVRDEAAKMPGVKVVRKWLVVDEP